MNHNLSTERTLFGVITPEIGLTGGISGATGVPGTSYYVFFKYSAAQPTTSEEISDTPNEWIGVYSGTKTIAPLDPSEYTWYKYRGLPGPAGTDGAVGPKGDTGDVTPEAEAARDDAGDFAQAAHDSAQTASEKAGQAESAMGAAIAAADEAGWYYASLIGTELEVDVINGTLNLYSAGDYSPINIELNDRSLEVWRA